MFALLQVCLCCLHANFLPAFPVQEKAKRRPNDGNYFRKEWDLQQNKVNDRASYETIDVFLSSHNIQYIAIPHSPTACHLTCVVMSQSLFICHLMTSAICCTSSVLH